MAIVGKRMAQSGGNAVDLAGKESTIYFRTDGKTCELRDRKVDRLSSASPGELVTTKRGSDHGMMIRAWVWSQVIKIGGRDE